MQRNSQPHYGVQCLSLNPRYMSNLQVDAVSQRMHGTRVSEMLYMRPDEWYLHAALTRPASALASGRCGRIARMRPHAYVTTNQPMTAFDPGEAGRRSTRYRNRQPNGPLTASGFVSRMDQFRLEQDMCRHAMKVAITP